MIDDRRILRGISRGWESLKLWNLKMEMIDDGRDLEGAREQAVIERPFQPSPSFSHSSPPPLAPLGRSVGFSLTAFLFNFPKSLWTTTTAKAFCKLSLSSHLHLLYHHFWGIFFLKRYFSPDPLPNLPPVRYFHREVVLKFWVKAGGWASPKLFSWEGERNNFCWKQFPQQVSTNFLLWNKFVKPVR